jgi:hypothetical protein
MVMARRRRGRNPEDELPYGEWIPADAVMFNADGTVSVMTEPGEAAGYEPVENPEGEDEEDPYGKVTPILATQIKPGDRYFDLHYGYLYVEKVYPFDPKYPRSQQIETDRGHRDLDADRIIYVESPLARAANRGRRARNAHYGRAGEMEFVPQRLIPDLMNLWHLSKTAEGSNELARIDWTVDQFHKEHPEFTHSQIFRDLNAML